MFKVTRILTRWSLPYGTGAFSGSPNAILPAASLPARCGGLSAVVPKRITKRPHGRRRPDAGRHIGTPECRVDDNGHQENFAIVQ